MVNIDASNLRCDLLRLRPQPFVAYADGDERTVHSVTHPVLSDSDSGLDAIEVSLEVSVRQVVLAEREYCYEVPAGLSDVFEV